MRSGGAKQSGGPKQHGIAMMVNFSCGACNAQRGGARWISRGVNGVNPLVAQLQIAPDSQSIGHLLYLVFGLYQMRIRVGSAQVKEFHQT